MQLNKPILAIETSQAVCGAAVYYSNKEFAESTLQKDRSHASMLSTVIETALRQCKTTFSSLGGVAISVGPGSFTGLRIGMTAAKSIAYAQDIPLYCVPTHHALALEYETIFPKDSGFCLVQKANTTEYYFSRFTQQDGVLQAVEANLVLEQQNVPNHIQSGDTLVAAENWFAVEKYVNLSSPKPRFVAQWAFEHGVPLTGVEVDDVEPLYLKEFVIKKKVTV